MASPKTPSTFVVMATGQIESLELPGLSEVYCKSEWVAGSEWAVVAGQEEGASQTGRASDLSGRVHLNFPLELAWRSSSPSGWPRIVLSCFGRDWKGGDVARGYGSTHLPCAPGLHRRRVALFVPQSSSALQRLSAWLSGRRPEFIDPRALAGGEGRGVTRVRTEGFAWLSFNVVVKDAAALGYHLSPAAAAPASDLPALATANTLPTPAPYHIPPATTKRRDRRGSVSQVGGGDSTASLLGGQSSLSAPSLPIQSRDVISPEPDSAGSQRASSSRMAFGGPVDSGQPPPPKQMAPIVEASDDEDDADLVQTL